MRRTSSAQQHDQLNPLKVWYSDGASAWDNKSRHFSDSCYFIPLVRAHCGMVEKTTSPYGWSSRVSLL